MGRRILSSLAFMVVFGGALFIVGQLLGQARFDAFAASPFRHDDDGHVLVEVIKVWSIILSGSVALGFLLYSFEQWGRQTAKSESPNERRGRLWQELQTALGATPVTSIPASVQNRIASASEYADMHARGRSVLPVVVSAGVIAIPFAVTVGLLLAGASAQMANSSLSHDNRAGDSILTGFVTFIVATAILFGLVHVFEYWGRKVVERARLSAIQGVLFAELQGTSGSGQVGLQPTMPSGLSPVVPPPLPTEWPTTTPAPPVPPQLQPPASSPSRSRSNPKTKAVEDFLDNLRDTP
jgi:ethanolamine transporter EutH